MLCPFPLRLKQLSLCYILSLHRKLYVFTFTISTFYKLKYFVHDIVIFLDYHRYLNIWLNRFRFIYFKRGLHLSLNHKTPFPLIVVNV